MPRIDEGMGASSRSGVGLRMIVVVEAEMRRACSATEGKSSMLGSGGTSSTKGEHSCGVLTSDEQREEVESAHTTSGSQSC